MSIMEKATFGFEYIIKRENISRPIVTVNRTGKGLATGERDLICCGNCGAVMSCKAKFCMGCGAKFQMVKDIEKYKEYGETLSGQLEGQMSLSDLLGGAQ